MIVKMAQIINGTVLIYHRMHERLYAFVFYLY